MHDKKPVILWLGKKPHRYQNEKQISQLTRKWDIICLKIKARQKNTFWSILDHRAGIEKDKSVKKKKKMADFIPSSHKMYVSALILFAILQISKQDLLLTETETQWTKTDMTKTF